MAANVLRRISTLDLPDIAVIASMIAYSAIFSYLSILKNSAYQSYAWDLGIFNQALWTTTHNGRFFFTTVEQYIVPSGSFFGTHFSPVLFLVLPIYALFPSPNTLLVIQSCVLALAAFPIYLSARRELKNANLAAIVSCSYLAYPFVQGINWFDFHVEAFLPLFFGFSFYYLRMENWKRFILFILLSLAVIEQTAVVVAFIGIYLLLRYGEGLKALLQKRVGFQVKLAVPFVIIVLAVAWYTVQAGLKNTFFPVNPDELSIYNASSHWSVLGLTGNPLYLPLYLAQHPTGLVAAVEYDALLKAAFILSLFAPLLFLPLKNRYVLIATSWLVPVLLSNYPPYYEIGDQYPAFIIPFVFAAMLLALRSLDLHRWPRITLRKICSLILISSLAFSIAMGPYSPLSHSTIQLLPFPSFASSILQENNHTASLNAMVALVPSNASILTQSNIFVHVSSRLNAYVAPWDDSTFSSSQAFAQYINTLLNESTFVLLDVHPGYSIPSSPYLLSNVTSRPAVFGLYAYTDGIYLYQKDYGLNPVPSLHETPPAPIQARNLNPAIECSTWVQS
jgi:uncharacterized membrane protein